MNEIDQLVGAIQSFHKGRQRTGLERKYARMAEGAFEFFRGTDFLFVQSWPALRPADPGPTLLICGDLHLENLGAFFSADGALRYDINDFDEATIAPCSFDLVRCATSTLLAADSWGLEPTTATGMALDFIDAYCKQVIDDEGQPARLGVAPDLGPLGELMASVVVAPPADSIKRFIECRGKSWRLRPGRNLVQVKNGRRERLEAALEEAGWNCQDVLRRFAGIGSLGLRRYQVLAERDGELHVLSLKQAAPSALAPVAADGLPPIVNEAERVIWAERQLRGDPTEPLQAIQCGDISFRLRAVVPEESRADLNRLQRKPRKLRAAVAAAGRLTARSHRRGCAASRLDPSALNEWARSSTLEAVLASAVRMADRVVSQFRTYVRAYRAGAFSK